MGFFELLNELVAVDIVGRETMLRGHKTQSGGEVCLAHAWRAKKYHILSVLQETHGGQLVNLAFVNGGLEGKIEVIQHLLDGETGYLNLLLIFLGVFLYFIIDADIAFLLALLIAWTVKFAAMDNYIMIQMMATYMQVAPNTTITFDLYSKLCAISGKFKELFSKGQEETPQPAYAAQSPYTVPDPAAQAAPAAPPPRPQNLCSADSAALGTRRA